MGLVAVVLLLVSLYICSAEEPIVSPIHGQDQLTKFVNDPNVRVVYFFKKGMYLFEQLLKWGTVEINGMASQLIRGMQQHWSIFRMKEFDFTWHSVLQINVSRHDKIKYFLYSLDPVFKKGARCMPENYRPVSLTCVSCKILEHIIFEHFRTHLEQYGILTLLNHGFRAKFSSETQLLLTLQDLVLARDRKNSDWCCNFELFEGFRHGAPWSLVKVTALLTQIWSF